jgi:hypothetical protein
MGHAAVGVQVAKSKPAGSCRGPPVSGLGANGSRSCTVGPTGDAPGGSFSGGGAAAKGNWPITKAEHVFDGFCRPLRGAVAVGVDGIGHRLIGPRASELSSWLTAEYTRSGSVPTSRAVPAETASGRSVVSRITSTGLPRLGASSCTPPLSVRTTVERCSSRAKAP